MKLRISDKNSKLGKIANISTVPIKDCVNCAQCKKDCYALKAYRQFPSARAAWNNNSIITRTQPDLLMTDLMNYLDKYTRGLFRFHQAGDCRNNMQFDVYKSIAYLYPDVKFLLFTKNYNLDFNDIPDNFTVILSVWPGQALPANKTLKRAYLSTDPRTEDAIDCAGFCETCGACWTLNKINKNVQFNIH